MAPCLTFQSFAEIAAQYLRKGSKVYIEGSLRTRKYQAPDGSDRYATEIRAEQMQMLDGASGGQGGQQGVNNRRWSRIWWSARPSWWHGSSRTRWSAGAMAIKVHRLRVTINSINPQTPQSKSNAMPDGPVDDDIPF